MNNCIWHVKPLTDSTTYTSKFVFYMPLSAQNILLVLPGLPHKSKNTGHIQKRNKLYIYFPWNHSYLKAWTTVFDTSKHKQFQQLTTTFCVLHTTFSPKCLACAHWVMTKSKNPGHDSQKYKAVRFVLVNPKQSEGTINWIWHIKTQTISSYAIIIVLHATFSPNYLKTTRGRR